jgi:signal transduction histidine kinase
MTTIEREVELLRFLIEIDPKLEQLHNTEKAIKLAARLTRDFFDADAACVAVLVPGGRDAEIHFRLAEDVTWSDVPFAAFLRGERPELPDDAVLAPLERRERVWGAIGIRVLRHPLDRKEAIRFLNRIAATISKCVARLDRLRILEVRARIDRKIIEQLRPKDLFYQILHGLKSLTRYDHSAALLIHDEGPGALELVAEQIAWRKGKSERIGLVLPIGRKVQGLLETNEAYGFDRVGDGWQEWSGRDATELAAVLDYHAYDAKHGDPAWRERSMLCAPLAARDHFLGVLKIAACHHGTLGGYEADLVRRFLPHAAVAIRNLRRAESLELGILEAEKKSAMADLARGVSHDVNNAFGSVIPLVQQMLEEIREGRADLEVMRRDLEQIDASLQVCRRIFGGMLTFVKDSARRVGGGDVRRAIKSTISVLEGDLRRHGIRMEQDLPPDLPLVRGSQNHLEQLMLNLATNARDAMPKGGVLAIRARPTDGEIIITIGDTGTGISPENLRRIYEPFFTTKRSGTGLGLSICQSIVWDMQGTMSIESELGKGTTVTVHLPLANPVRAVPVASPPTPIGASASASDDPPVEDP